MENEFLKRQFETKEKEPIQLDMRVDFIRHGKPKYTKEEMQSATIEGKLTKKGIKQIEESAIELANKIDKEKELIIFWASPKQRAQQTAKILFDTFQKQNISVIKDLRTVKALSDVKMSPEFIKTLKNEAIENWMEYWTKSHLPEDTEKPEEVRGRVERIITYLERIARNIIPAEGKKLHFICIGHEEIFRDLLEEGYGLGTKDDAGPNYGEVMSMGINKSEQGKNATLKLEYRGKKVELDFDKENRKFYNPRAARQ